MKIWIKLFIYVIEKNIDDNDGIKNVEKKNSK